MYWDISDELRAAFSNFAPQKARVTVYSSGEMFVLASVDANGNNCLIVSETEDIEDAVLADAGRIYTEKNMTIGGLSINRYCAADSEIEFGNASSAEMTLVLNNSSGYINVDDFAGAEMFVEVGCQDIDEWIPMGWFVVDEVRQSGTTVTITCLDRMVYLDKPIDRSRFNEGMQIWEIMEYIAEDCGITLSDNFAYPEVIINTDYFVNEFPVEYTVTYRQLLVWVGQIMGSITYFNRNGELDWTTLWAYSDLDDAIDITPSNRFASEIASKPVRLTGLKIIDEDKEYYVGYEGYMIQFSNNGLMDHDFQNVLHYLWNGRNGFPYPGLKNIRPWYPFNAEIVPMPYIDMLDGIDYTNKLEEHFFSYVTDWTFTLNANTLIACKGDTAVYKRQTISPYNSTGGVSTPAKQAYYNPPMLQTRFTEVYVEAHSDTTITDVMPKSMIGNYPLYFAMPWGDGHRCVINSVTTDVDPSYVRVEVAVFNDNNTDDEFNVDCIAVWYDTLY